MNPILRTTRLPYLALILTISCSSKAPKNQVDKTSDPVKKDTTVTAVAASSAGSGTTMASPAAIMAKPQVPILCYHQIRDYRPTDSKSARDYIVPPAIFRDQMKALADSGYTTILPDQLYQYLAYGATLPEKSILISFDDGCDEQFDIAHSILDPLKFKASFFIMTVSINRPNYMKSEQIKQLSDEGHDISLHTWDHHNVKLYQGADWVTQIEKPKATLEKITGKPIQYFAYPFGLWNPQAIPELKSRGLKAAFQLATARDEQEPLYTIRRIIVTGDVSGQKLIGRIHGSFSTPRQMH